MYCRYSVNEMYTCSMIINTVFCYSDSSTDYTPAYSLLFSELHIHTHIQPELFLYNVFRVMCFAQGFFKLIPI